jgi:hypothetical protein
MFVKPFLKPKLKCEITLFLEKSQDIKCGTMPKTWIQEKGRNIRVFKRK